MEQIPSNIKHMVSVAPGNATAEQFFFYRDLLKTSLPCPSANHYQLCSMNIVIDNEEAGQQIKCQVWLEAWCLIICS